MKSCKLFVLTALFLMISMSAAFGESISVTTGLPITKENKPIVCQMDNEPGARPQKGIDSADVVYETEVYNGGYTRYTCVFNDVIPQEIEAVRSARILHLDLYQDWGGIFACYGFQFAEGTDARSYAKKVVDVLFDGNAGESGFYRDSDRRAPNNVVFKMGEKYDSVQQSFAEKNPLTFSDTPTIKGDEVSAVNILYQKSYNPSYIWNDEQQVYLRFYNGNPHVDGATGEQLAYKNIIVQYAEYSWYGGASNRPVAKLTGKNRCEYFIGGHHFSGCWTRESLDTNTRYFDDEGNPVVFAKGKTFVQIVKESIRVNWGMETVEDELLKSYGMGSSGEAVYEIQSRLIELGFLSSEADGLFGAKTEKAVMDAQMSWGMEATGIADARFIQRLSQE